ncbi:LysR family transcriptional regulator [Sulfitobacter sp. AS92]|uniref:LysR family transcriptional regulator n=1 Tax=Sulfitobacter sp. AS92 TaxID=3135783 RepID=UPI0031746DED
MDPKHLFYLSEIIRYGSLSRASEHLGVVQPTLTRIVKALEDQVGSPLLVRGRYGVSPTDIGDQLATTGMEIAKQIATASDAISTWNAGLGRELRVGVGPMLAVSIASKFLDEYLRRKRPFALAITTATAGKLVDQLNNGEIDIAIAPSRLNMHQEKLVQEVILDDHMAVYAGAKSKLRGLNRVITPSELANEEWAIVGARSNIYEDQNGTFEMLRIPHTLPRISFSGDITMCLSLLETSFVLVCLPKRLTEFTGRIAASQRLQVDAVLPPRNVAFWATKENWHKPQVIHFRNSLLKWLTSVNDTVRHHVI